VTFGEPLNESDLVLNARRGDPAAWEAMIARHREAVFRYAYLQLGDRSEAEDVAQESFLRAFRSFQRFDGARPLRPWLLRIARNLSRNRWRSWTRRLRATERWKNEAASEAAGLAPSTEGGLADAAAELRSVVAGMRDDDRQVLYLRFFLGLSLEEAGEALALPVGTVKSRLSRALGRLREAVQREYPALRQALEE
jgi:RNA polymerase sigma-70 factor (ECF subfamily)